MSLLRVIAERLRSLFRKQQEERELSEELRSFLEMGVEVRRGMSRQEGFVLCA